MSRFEGVEGSGKSTQMARVFDHFQEKKVKTVKTREPGGTEIAERIRNILIHQESEKLDSRSELLLLLASRSQHVQEFIFKHQSDCDLILCDRYTDSTLAYQGGGRGMDLEWLGQLNNFASHRLEPDLTFLMDLPVEKSQIRIQRRKKREDPNGIVDRFESEEKKFHERVRQTYLDLAEKHKDRFCVVNAVRKPRIIFEKMILEIQKRLDAR